MHAFQTIIDLQEIYHCPWILTKISSFHHVVYRWNNNIKNQFHHLFCYITNYTPLQIWISIHRTYCEVIYENLNTHKMNQEYVIHVQLTNHVFLHKFTIGNHFYECVNNNKNDNYFHFFYTYLLNVKLFHGMIGWWSFHQKDIDKNFKKILQKFCLLFLHYFVLKSHIRFQNQ